MATVEQLKRDLAEAQERERLAKLQCQSCGGKGWVSDTTYDRTGVDFRCSRCHGTGLPQDQVSAIVDAAVAPYRKPMRS